MPLPKQKKAKVTLKRAANQPSLLSFWGKKSSSKKDSPDLLPPPIRANDDSVSHKQLVADELQDKLQDKRPIVESASTASPVSTQLNTISPTERISDEDSSSAAPAPAAPVSPEAVSKEKASSTGNDCSSTENMNDDDDMTDESESEDDGKQPSSPQLLLGKNNPEYNLSDYELFRLRNIARNNARMEALGLLNNVPQQQSATATATAVKKKRRPAKRPADHQEQQSSNSLPKRRSTRLSKQEKSGEPGALFSSTCTTTDSNQPFTTSNEATATLPEEEPYEVSPMVQYEMENNRLSKLCIDTPLPKNDDDENAAAGSDDVTSLVPTGQRLAPPPGLSAIYSLNFCSNNNWVVGAGKAGIVALWNVQQQRDEESTVDEDHNDSSSIINYTDPIFSWKAHSGRWISEAQFLNDDNNNNTQTTASPSRLLTAANDGTVCLWDLSKVSSSTKAPKLLKQSDKSWHSSGIFAMDTTISGNASTKIVTGSKDKTVAIATNLESSSFCPTWRSHVHTAKVGAVKFRDNHVLASASDDGSVAILDDRMNDAVALLEDLHNGRPHSVVWDHHHDSIFLTAGLDSIIQAWDLRYLKKKKGANGQFVPVTEYHGHVPTSTRRCKRIHHPVFFQPTFSNNNRRQQRRSSEDCCFVLTGGEGSRALNMFQATRADPSSSAASSRRPIRTPIYSRGLLPPDCSHTDVGSIASTIHGDTVAATVDGEVLLLKPLLASS